MADRTLSIAIIRFSDPPIEADANCPGQSLRTAAAIKVTRNSSTEVLAVARIAIRQLASSIPWTIAIELNMIAKASADQATKLQPWGIDKFFMLLPR